MPNHTPEQIARAAGLGPEHSKVGIDGNGPDVYWYSPGDDCTPDRCEYIGPDYPNDPGACAQDLLPVLWARGWMVRSSKNYTEVCLADDSLCVCAFSDKPNHFARAICQAVVATAEQPA